MVLLVTLVFVGSIGLLLMRLWGVSSPTLMLLIALTLASVVVGSLLSSFVGSGLIEPIVQLSEASRKVAAGDFSIRLEAQHGIDEIQTMLENFNTMVEELGSTETLRSDFVASVSHEFKTPITAIEGYATLLQDPGLTQAEQAECVDKILFNTGRLSALVGNILLLSKIENQTISLPPSQFRLDEQLRQALVLLEPKWAAKEIDFDVELDTVQYWGYESLLAQVWVNLLDNAIKFSPVGSAITVKLRLEADQAVVEIADCGMGMSEEIQRHIFEKFYQGDSSHRSQGNGLGLALVHKVVELSQGQIQVESAPGEGSLFRVRLPLGCMGAQKGEGDALLYRPADKTPGQTGFIS